MAQGFKTKKTSFFRKFLLVGCLILLSIFSLTPKKSYAACPPGQVEVVVGGETPVVTCVTGTSTTTAQQDTDTGGSSSFWMDIALKPFLVLINIIMTVIQMIIAIFLGIAGLLLNKTIEFSITDMAKNISALKGINIAWKLIRDLCNMSFIFILLYNGIMTIFTSDNKAKKIIVPVIIAALLINFSLFFTKLIIDASNIVSISFYNSITQAVVGDSIGGTIGGRAVEATGLAGALMKSLNLTSLFSSSALSILSGGDAAYKLIWANLGSAIFMLVATFVFIAMAVLFLIRYIVFIFLLIISPLGYMASVIPGLQSTSKKYWDTLLGQAYFAPIFMIMIWIILTLIDPNNGFFGISPSGSLIDAITAPTSGSIGIILNYCIIIGFLILSLIVSKDFATKGGIVTGKMVGVGTAFLGSTVFGGAAAIGRGTFGARANTMANDEALKERAKTSWIAKQQLKASKYVAGSSFDTRRSFIGEQTQKISGIDLGKGTIFNEKAGKGGYEQRIKDKQKQEEDYAKSLKPSEEATEAAKKLRDEAFKNPAFILAEEKRKADYLNSDEYTKKQRGLAEKIAALNVDIESKTIDEQRAIRAQITKMESTFKNESDVWMSDIKKGYIKNAGGQEEKKSKGGIITQAKVESLADERAEAYAKTIDKKVEKAENSWGYTWNIWHGNPQLNKAAAAKVRALKKSKSAKDKIAEAAKDLSKEDEASEPVDTPAPVTSGSPAPTGPVTP